MQQKELDEIKALGAMAYTTAQVAEIMGVPHLDDEMLQHYKAGFYENDFKVRKSIMDLAARGSSPAQAMARRMIDETQMKQHYE